MVNIYGPNQDKPIFFENVFKLMEKDGIRNWIIGGDWNLVVNQHLDPWNYKSLNNPNSTNIVKHRNI